MPNFTGQKDLQANLQLLWRWKLLFLFFVVGVPVAAYVYERAQPTLYRSSALVGIDQATVNTALVPGGGSFSTSNVLAIAQLVNTPPVATIAAHLLRPPGNPSQIAGEVSASGDQNTNFLTITVQDRSPRRAAEIANAFARGISLNRQQAAISQLDSAIKGIQAQLKSKAGKNATLRPGLEQQLIQLRAAKSTQGSNAAILRPATPSGSPAAPNIARSVELSIVVGVLLGLGAVVLAEHADRRMRTPDELEDMVEVPVLATVPATALSAKLETTKADEEAFHMVRVALASYHAEKPVQSIVVTSPAEKEGKTTVASRLALSMARAGGTVVLVDADLRRGQLSRKFGIQPRLGLSAVLAEELPLSEALVDYPLEEPGSGRLTVLPAGSPQRHASALITSPVMARVINDLTSQSDLVIIDTPAALAVSDPLSLMRSVSGAIVVARMNVSRRRALRRLVQMIAAAHGSLLGVVAVGVTRGVDYYGYSHYHETNGAEGTGARSRLRRSVGQAD